MESSVNLNSDDDGVDGDGVVVKRTSAQSHLALKNPIKHGLKSLNFYCRPVTPGAPLRQADNDTDLMQQFTQKLQKLRLRKNDNGPSVANNKLTSEEGQCYCQGQGHGPDQSQELAISDTDGCDKDNGDHKDKSQWDKGQRKLSADDLENNDNTLTSQPQNSRENKNLNPSPNPWEEVKISGCSAENPLENELETVLLPRRVPAATKIEGLVFEVQKTAVKVAYLPHVTSNCGEAQRDWDDDDDDDETPSIQEIFTCTASVTTATTIHSCNTFTVLEPTSAKVQKTEQGINESETKYSRNKEQEQGYFLPPEKNNKITTANNIDIDYIDNNNNKSDGGKNINLKIDDDNNNTNIKNIDYNDNFNCSFFQNSEVIHPQPPPTPFATSQLEPINIKMAGNLISDPRQNQNQSQIQNHNQFQSPAPVQLTEYNLLNNFSNTDLSHINPTEFRYHTPGFPVIHSNSNMGYSHNMPMPMPMPTFSTNNGQLAIPEPHFIFQDSNNSCGNGNNNNQNISPYGQLNSNNSNGRTLSRPPSVSAFAPHTFIGQVPTFYGDNGNQLNNAFRANTPQQFHFQSQRQSQINGNYNGNGFGGNFNPGFNFTGSEFISDGGDGFSFNMNNLNDNTCGGNNAQFNNATGFENWAPNFNLNLNMNSNPNPNPGSNANTDFCAFNPITSENQVQNLNNSQGHCFMDNAFSDTIENQNNLCLFPRNNGPSPVSPVTFDMGSGSGLGLGMGNAGSSNLKSEPNRFVFASTGFSDKAFGQYSNNCNFFIYNLPGSGGYGVKRGLRSYY